MVSKYERLAADLRRLIAQNALPAGTRLPTEAELIGKHGVSLGTVRKALAVLEAEGLVERFHGTGTFVRQQRQRMSRSSQRYQWEKDRVLLPEEQRRQSGAVERDTGLTVADLTFSARYSSAAADDDLAGALGVPAGTRLLRREYETRQNGDIAPFGLTTSHLPYDLVAANPMLLDETNEPWPGGTQHQLFTVGIELDRIVDQVTARPPTADEANLLQIRPGSALVSIRKISVDTNDRAVEVADIRCPGDRLELFFVTHLTRWTA